MPPDTTTEQVQVLFDEAKGELEAASRIFATETTDQHRTQWPNVYRLESATHYAEDVITAADPKTVRLGPAEELRSAATQARDAIRAAVDNGGGDLIGSADRLLAATSQVGPAPVPPDLRQIVEKLRQEFESTKSSIESQLGQVGPKLAAETDQAIAAIQEDVDAVKERRVAADQQAAELGLTTTSIAAHNLADTYASEAKKTEGQAKHYTWTSLAMGVVSVLTVIVGLLLVKEPSSFETVIAHAAFGLPVALFAAYINSLASTHRREAWRLRHIELQIKTANPFLGLLDTPRREETLAALALRFFPGQEGVGFDGQGAPEASPELLDLLRRIVAQQAVALPAASSAGAQPQKPA